MEILKTIGNKIATITFDLIFENKLTRKIRLNKANSFLSIVNLNDIRKLNTSYYINLKKEKVFIDQDDSKITEYLNDFLNVMNNNFSKEELYNLYNNVVWVKIKQNKFLKILNDKGRCNALKNSISFSDKEDVNTLRHELLHLSSNPMDEKNPCSGGFYYEFEDGKNIGSAIDEGYTEYMIDKYFDNQNDSPYFVEMAIVKELEDFVGKDKMEKFYLEGNVFGLIKVLSNYFALSNIERFIASTDFILHYRNKYYLIEQEEEILYSQYEETLIFLLKMYCIRIKNENNLDIPVFKEHFNNLLYGIEWNFIIDEQTEREIYKTIYDILKVNIDLTDIIEKHRVKNINI